MSPAPRVALVTGAAGGLGTALVSTLVSQGYRVVAEDRDARVNELAGEGVATVQGDAADAATADASVAAAVSRFGRLDVLINNAAIFLRRPLAEMRDSEWDLVMRVNARAPFVHCRACVGELGRTGGSILNIASTSGLVGMAQQVAYASSKGAVIQLTRQLAVELAPRGIRVNAIAPGATDTGFARNSPLRISPLEENMRERTPLRRMLTPREVAEAAVRLVGDAASSTTGSVFAVDGGFLAG